MIANGESALEKRSQAAIGRDEMEDKYLKLQDDHLLLKKHARNQEEKLKKLTTKVSRLISDKKRLEEDGGKKRDVEKDEILQDLEDRVRTLEKENVHLKEKLLVTKQQVVNNLKRRTPYQYVHPKVDTGISRPASSQHSHTRAPVVHPSLPQYALNLLEEARDEITGLEELVASHRLQLELYEQGIETLKEQMKVRENEHEEEMVALKVELTHGKKQHVQENIDLIKMNREVKHKSSHLTTLQAQYSDLEEKMKMSHEHFGQQIELLTKQLKDERAQNVQLQTELNSTLTLQNNVAQLQAQVQDLKQENALIKESHDKLVTSALEVGSKNGSTNQELNHLENVLKTELNERKLLLQQLQQEKERRNKLENEVEELKRVHGRTEAEKVDLQTQINFFRQESGIDFKELEEALSLVEEKKMASNHHSDSPEKGDTIKNNSSQNVQAMQIEHSETVGELEKTRNMLILQYKINQECQLEIQKLKKQQQAQLEENKHLLEIRSARIEESAKAMGYLSANQRVTEAALDVLGKPSSTSDNQLHIKIFRCIALQGQRKGVQPSPYCVYKFYDAPDYSTVIIPSSNNPQFNDHKIFPVNVTPQLNSYLRTRELEICVYDQKDSTTYLGRVRIPLDSLTSSNVPCQGTYSLLTPKRVKNGTIDVAIYWQHPYEAPSGQVSESETSSVPDIISPHQQVVSSASSSSQKEEQIEESFLPSTTIISTDDMDGSSHLSSEEEISISSEDLNEEVVVSPRHTPVEVESTIVVAINQLELDADAAILQDPAIQMLFVEYKFLDFPPEELETPFALPKPIPPQHIAYNFRKVFHLARKKQILTQMLQTDSRLKFTVVSEPPMDQQDLDCHDVGVAYFDFLQIMKERKDFMQKDIDIYDATNQKLKIGKLNVSVQALAMLKQILPNS